MEHDERACADQNGDCACITTDSTYSVSQALDEWESEGGSVS